MRKGARAVLARLRNFVCGVLIVPTFLLAQDANRGMLYSDGGTRLNENSAPAVAAIFPDSLVQTQPGYTAKIDVAGSTVLIQPETVMRFLGHGLALEHGSVQLDTARGMEVVVGCITVTPKTTERTQYTVTDVDGKVKVSAAKNEVQIHLRGEALAKSKEEASFDVMVKENEQVTRPERCGEPAKRARVAGATGGVLSNPWVIGSAGIAAVGLACFGLCRGDEPISPDKP